MLGRRPSCTQAVARETKEAFFRRHAAAMYDVVTANRTLPLRVAELVYGAADRFPGLLPTRKQIEAERALKKQIAKEGLEIDQGLFVAHVLADEALRHASCPRHAAAKARGGKAPSGIQAYRPGDDPRHHCRT